MQSHKRKRRTKIVCTLGPATSEAVLEEMFLAGMDVARLNFSHGTHDDHARRIRQVRALEQVHQRPVAILQDLAGPKIRVGEFPEGQVELVRGQEFTLTSVPHPGGPDLASVSYPEIIAETPVGATVLLADGGIELHVEAKGPQTLTCRVKGGGVVRSHAGLNFPGHSLSIPAFTEKDREDLRFGVNMGVDYVGLSFVRQGQDIQEVRDFLNSLGASISIIAKIERHEALHRLEEILEAADALMVARGDLGVEVALERVPLLQKRIIAAANRVGKPVITATQMLLSMVEHPRPTRAEAADVANAILDGTDAVMLSEETARGRFPVAAVKFLDQISRATETQFPHAKWLQEHTAFKRHAISEAVSYAACEMARDLGAAAILTSTSHGFTARLISRFRPQAPIIGVTPHRETWRRLALSWGVFSLLTAHLEDTDHMFHVVKEEALRAGWLKPGDRVVITAGTPIGTTGATNLLKADVV